MITAEQMRAARAMLRIEQGTLAERAGVSAETIKRFEAMQGPLKGRDETIRGIVQAFEFQGIEFLESEGANGLGGVGVRIAFDRSAKLRNRIADHVAQIVRGILSEAYVSDPDIFDRGADFVSYLINSSLPELVRQEMPAILDPKVSGD